MAKLSQEIQQNHCYLTIVNHNNTSTHAHSSNAKEIIKRKNKLFTIVWVELRKAKNVGEGTDRKPISPSYS